MALPSNSFMFNYNAKEYDAVTHTFPKTQGQLFDEDIVLNKAPSSYGDDYVYFGNSQAYTGRTGYTSSNNPFNRNSTNCTLTFIYKTSGWTTSDGWKRIFANRHPASSYNWWIMSDRLNNLLVTPPNRNPQYFAVRVYSNNSAKLQYFDENGNEILSASTNSIDWYQNSAQGFGFFHGYGNGGDSREYFNQTFYWMYCSLETLNDEEILQVINYNEKLGSFGIEPENLSFDYTGGTSSLTITTDEGWTASTSDSWITLSSTSGTGDSTINITAQLNKGQQRTGYVNVTDGSNTLACTISQEKYPVLVPYNNLYINGNRVN